MELLFRFILPIVIILLAIDKNDYFFGLVLTLYSVIVSYFFGGIELNFSFGVIMAILLIYVVTVLSFKVANKLANSSKLLYFLIFEICYNLLYMIIISFLI